MALCFFINFFTTRPNFLSVLDGLFIPQVPTGTIDQLVGLIGSVIMPHNIYLHSALVLSRKIDSHSRSQVKESVVYNAVESSISLGVSFFINFAIVGTFAFYHGTPLGRQLNLQNAHLALESSFGAAAKYIWAVGLLASGQSSTMTGTYAGQFVMEVRESNYFRVFSI